MRHARVLFDIASCELKCAARASGVLCCEGDVRCGRDADPDADPGPELAKARVWYAHCISPVGRVGARMDA